MGIYGAKAPVFVDDVGAAWRPEWAKLVLRAHFLHVESDLDVFVWARLERHGGSDICGPMALSAAEQVAKALEGKVRWLSRYHEPRRPVVKRQRKGKPRNEPTFHAGEEAAGTCQRPAETHFQ